MGKFGEITLIILSNLIFEDNKVTPISKSAKKIATYDIDTYDLSHDDGVTHVFNIKT